MLAISNMGTKFFMETSRYKTVCPPSTQKNGTKEEVGVSRQDPGGRGGGGDSSLLSTRFLIILGGANGVMRSKRPTINVAVGSDQSWGLRQR